MDISELNKQELSIDEWIDIFKEKVQTEKSEEKIEEFNNTLDFLNHVKTKTDLMQNNTISESILFCMKYICDSFGAIFNTWECSIIQYNTHIVLCNDIVFIELSDIRTGIGCSVSFNYQANPILVAETTMLLHNIFSTGLDILTDVFMINPLNQEYIWGENNIIKYKRESQPLKLNQIVIFGEEGNC